MSGPRPAPRLDLAPRDWSPAGVPLAERVVRDLLSAVGRDHRDADVVVVEFTPHPWEARAGLTRSGFRVYLDDTRVFAVSAPGGHLPGEPRGNPDLRAHVYYAPTDHTSSEARVDGLYLPESERERSESLTAEDLVDFLELGGRGLLPHPEYAALRDLAHRRPAALYPGHVKDASTPLGVSAGSVRGEVARVASALAAGAPDEWALRLLTRRPA